MLGLLSDAANGELDDGLTALGGISSLLTADCKTNAIRLGLELRQTNAAPLEYDISLTCRGYGY